MTPQCNIEITTRLPKSKRKGKKLVKIFMKAIKDNEQAVKSRVHEDFRDHEFNPFGYPGTIADREPEPEYLPDDGY